MEPLKVPLAESNLFYVELELAREKLTRHEYKTLLGQAKHGNVEAAAKGLKKILLRGKPNE